MRRAASGQVPPFRPEQSPGYLYEQLAAYLEGLITAGTLRPHTLLPAERRMTEEYGVSLGTARHATELLRRRGLVVTIRSKGTYVASLPSTGAAPVDAAMGSTDDAATAVEGSESGLARFQEG
ncbi:winged helix-turn-helix domain-containing protein [Amycolatopsis taiwanensis]|nr:winged helix-turn-helix domain-containing protein [Amycolatopsis taiwanensis]